MTKQEHRVAYEAHKKQVHVLFKRAEKQTATALSSSLLADAHRLGFEHNATVAELLDELAAMNWHYTAAMLLEEAGQ